MTKPIIAMQECAHGNGEVGEMWIEAATFSPDTPVKDVLIWAQEIKHSGGRLMLTYDKTPHPTETE